MMMPTSSFVALTTHVMPSAFARHLVDDVAHRRVGRDDRRVGAAVHQLIDAHQLLAELAARMDLGEVLFAESLFDEQRHAERVAHRERGGRAGGRHEIERARFFGHLAVERHVGRLRERRRRVAGDGDDARADAPDGLEQAQHFLRLAAVRNREQHIVRLDDAEIAVRRFGGMEEECRRARARQRRRDLAADDAGLAHARDDDAPLAFVEHPHGAVEALVEAIDERQDGRGLGLQHLARERAVGRRRVVSCTQIVKTGSDPVSDDGRRASPSRVRIRCRSSGSRRSSGSAFCASLFARGGLSCTSTNSPSMPAATAARRERLDVFGLAGRDAVAAARQLQAVRRIVDHRVAERAQHRERAHVDDQVVVAEAEAALGDEHLRVARFDDLRNRVLHVGRREELPLLDVDHPAGLAPRPRAGRSAATGTPESAARRRLRRPAPPGWPRGCR